MAKKKAKKSAVKSESKSVKKENVVKVKVFTPAKLFFKSLFLAILVFAIYVLWTRPWVEGIGLILFLIIVYFGYKIYSRYKKNEKN